MNKVLFCAVILLTVFGSRGQESAVVIQGGSGLPYMVESSDETVDINYYSTVAVQLGWLHQPDDFYFAWHVNMQYLNTLIEGVDWQRNVPVDATLASLTTSLLLERMTSYSRFNYGYTFGVGITFEGMVGSTSMIVKDQRRFFSVTAEPILSYNISDRLALRLSPKLLWFDPINSLGPKENWRIGGEDLNLLLQAGFRVQL